MDSQNLRCFLLCIGINYEDVDIPNTDQDNTLDVNEEIDITIFR